MGSTDAVGAGVGWVQVGVGHGCGVHVQVGVGHGLHVQVGVGRGVVLVLVGSGEGAVVVGVGFGVGVVVGVGVGSGVGVVLVGVGSGVGVVFVGAGVVGSVDGVPVGSSVVWVGDGSVVGLVSGGCVGEVDVDVGAGVGVGRVGEVVDGRVGLAVVWVGLGVVVRDAVVVGAEVCLVGSVAGSSGGSGSSDLSGGSGVDVAQAEAVQQVHGHNAKIHADETDGERRHRRVPRWVRSLRTYITGFEALGLAVFTATALNIDFLDPFDNFSGWLLAVVVVAVMLPLQHFLVKRSSEAFNHYREALAEQQAFPAQSAKQRTISSGVGATLVGGAITFALIERFITVTDITDPFIYWLMIALCTVTGIGMPLFAWFGHAWDGSRISRERDDLAEALDESLIRHNGLLNYVNLENTRFIDGRINLTERVIPTIVNITSIHVDNARKAYAFLRIQLGGLATKPPYCERNYPAKPTDKWYLHTDIPGAEPIYLKLLENRASKIASLDAEREQAIHAITQLPTHPWAHGCVAEAAGGTAAARMRN